MAIRLSCPNPDCGAVANVEEQSLGKRGRCKKCGHVFALARPDGEGASAVSGDGSAWKRGSARGSNPLELPEQFGRYRIMSQLGRGGMGAVYLAFDTKLEREVALKVPYFNPADGPQAVQRFEREARAAATLDHPNLCPVHDVGEIDGIHYLTMPYIKGKTLSDVIGLDHAVTEAQAAAIALKLAQALQEAHDRGIIHRDLKPGNIMVNRRRELIVMDFGLARMAGGDSSLTGTGNVLGTALYMAPEQAAGDLALVGPAADVYSLGVILYELLTGRHPFEGPWGLVIGLKNVKDPDPPSKHRPDLSPTLDAICHKAIAKDPKDRYPTMNELAQELGVYLKSASNPVLTPSGTVHPDQRPESLAGQVFMGIVTDEITSIREERSVAQPIPERPKKSAPSRSGWAGVVSAVGAGILLLGVIVYVVKEEGQTRKLVDQRGGNKDLKKTLETAQAEKPKPKPNPVSDETSPKLEEAKTDDEESKPVAPVSPAQEMVIVEGTQPSPPAMEPGKAAPTGENSKSITKNDRNPTKKGGGTRNRPTEDLSGFQPLVFRKDLAGWKQDGNGSAVVSEDGLLTLTHSADDATGIPAILETERDNYRNFRLRFEILSPDDIRKSFIIRYSNPSGTTIIGYAISVGGTTSPTNNQFEPVGSILAYRDAPKNSPPVTQWDYVAKEVPVAIGVWQLMEITAIGPRIWVKVNGKTVSEYVDPQPVAKTGRFRLLSGMTSASYRNMMIQELDASGAVPKNLSIDSEKGPEALTQTPEKGRVTKDRPKASPNPNRRFEGSAWSGIQHVASTGVDVKVGFKILKTSNSEFKGVWIRPDVFEIEVIGTITGSTISFTAKSGIYDIKYEGSIMKDGINLNYEGINMEGIPVDGKVLLIPN